MQSFFVDKDSKHLKWCDLTRPEKLKVFNSIDIPKLFPNFPCCHIVQTLLKDFFLNMHNFTVHYCSQRGRRQRS